jgi:transposase
MPRLRSGNDHPPRYNHKLTAEQREEILRRLAAGETQASIGRDFQVSHTTVYLVKKQASEAGQADRERAFKKRLLPAETDRLKSTIQETLPTDHGIRTTEPEKPDVWTITRARELARKLFGKSPSVRALTECVPQAPPRVYDFGLTPPKPPGPPNVDLLPPDLAADKDFVKYYLSPIARQIEQREYEAALAHYHERLAREGKLKAEAPEAETGSETDSDDELSPPPSPPVARAGFPTGPPAPGTRVGKHAKSKGNPFTKPKRRKKKR